MAHAQGRLLTEVHGSIENGRPHYAFVRNGKQFIGCVRKGWNTELKTDTQKITALNFAYASAVANMIGAAVNAGKSEKYLWSISYLFRSCRVGRSQYFFDETLFDAVNEVMSKYFKLPFFTVSGTFNDDWQHYTINPDIVAAMPEKTALRYSVASFLMAHADRINLPKLYDDLSQVSGATYDESDIYPLQDVYEAYSLLKLSFWRWASLPVLTIVPQNYDTLLQMRRDKYDHRTEFAEQQAEALWRPSL